MTWNGKDLVGAARGPGGRASGSSLVWLGEGAEEDQTEEASAGRSSWPDLASSSAKAPISHATVYGRMCWATWPGDVAGRQLAGRVGRLVQMRHGAQNWLATPRGKA